MFYGVAFIIGAHRHSDERTYLLCEIGVQGVLLVMMGQAWERKSNLKDEMKDKSGKARSKLKHGDELHARKIVNQNDKEEINRDNGNKNSIHSRDVASNINNVNNRRNKGNQSDKKAKITLR